MMTTHWNCSSCKKLLGRIENGQLVIEHGRLIVRAMPSGVERRCDSCGTWNHYPVMAGESAA